MKSPVPGVAGLFALLFCIALSAGAAAQRAWTVEDSIAVRYFTDVTRDIPEFWSSGPQVFVPSPDGQRFFFVTRRGNLECDCNINELQIFEAEDVRRALAGKSSTAAMAPYRKLEFRSSRPDMFHQSISGAGWDGSQAIVFRGVEGKSNRAIFRFDVAAGRLQQLTDEKHDVWGFHVGGGSIVYEGYPQLQTRTALNEYPMRAIVGDELLQLADVPLGTAPTFYARYRAGGIKPLNALAAPAERTGQGPQPQGPWISPDGRWAVMAFAPGGEATPQEWQSYDGQTPASRKPLARFVLVDLETGESKAMLNAPTGAATRAGSTTAAAALWFRDSARVVLVNTALPLKNAQNERLHTTYIAEYDVRAGTASVIAPLFGPLPTENPELQRYAKVDWINAGRELLIEVWTRNLRTGVHTATARTAYSLNGRHWVAKTAPVDARSTSAARKKITGFELVLRESANDPPVALAISGTNEVRLTSADPALQNLRRAPVQSFQWREPDGRTFVGGLMMPRQNEASGPPPLAIQIYHYQPRLFRPDGPFSSAYAAQALVSAGFAVLQIESPGYDRPGAKGTPDEGRVFVERIDSAVDALAAAGTIDRKRVAAIGFSRAGYGVYYAITHPGRTRLAAAVIADSVTYAYAEYLWEAATTGNPAAIDLLAYHRQHAGKAFWEDKPAWLEHSTAFNADRIATPALFMKHGTLLNLMGGSMETIAALRTQRLPFEFVFFPDGAHELTLPQQRKASLQSTVDWLRFWVQGEEHLVPWNDAKFDRWRQQRLQWERQ